MFFISFIIFYFHEKTMMLKSNIIAYTDDVVLLTPSLTGLQNLFNAFDNNINITICCDMLYHYMMIDVTDVFH